MENTKGLPFIYHVGSDLETSTFFAEFESEDKAIAFAKRNMDKLPFVQKVILEYDENGIETAVDYIDIWDHTMENTADTETEDNYWDLKAAQFEEEEKNKYDLGDTTWFESVDTNDLVEAMEENEDVVECKECFELFPKADCIKLEVGYICPTCSSHCCDDSDSDVDIILVADEDTFKVDFPEYEKFNCENDMIPAEVADTEKECTNKPSLLTKEILDQVESENNSISNPDNPDEVVPFLVKDEEEAIAGYEKAAEVIEASDVENKEEILDTLDHIKEEEEEHIEELTDLVDDEIIEVENDSISEEEEIETIEDPEPAQLNELFGFGKKKKDTLNRYSIKLNQDTSGRIATGDLWDELYWVVKDHVSSVKKTLSDSYASMFEFVATEQEFEAIKKDIDRKLRFLPRRYLSGVDTINSKGVENPDIKDSLAQLLTFKCLERDIKESLEEFKNGLVEHVNEEHPAIESDQELKGIDNAIVDCEVAKVITHSEDEKPVDCKGKKRPLKKPLTEAAIVGRLGSEADEIDLIEFTELCKEIGIKTVSDLDYFIKSESDRPGTILDKLKSYRAELGADFEITNESKLTELFGFGKKKSKNNRYIAAIFRDKSGCLATADLSDELWRIIRKHAGSVEDSYRKHFSDYTLHQYEFVTTIDKYYKIQDDLKEFISDLPSRYFSGPYSDDISDSLRNLFEFDCLETGVKESLDDEKKLITETFTKEEQEEYNMDENGVSLDGYDEYVRCTWCGEIFTKDSCVFEADMGWLCDRCYQAILSRGEKLTIIKNPTDEDIARTLTEEVKMTAKELKDKFGTDDVDLINAGREPEERVELTEDTDEIELTSDPAEKNPDENVRMANTASTSGMDFEAACQTFGVELQEAVGEEIKMPFSDLPEEEQEYIKDFTKFINDAIANKTELTADDILKFKDNYSKNIVNNK